MKQGVILTSAAQGTQIVGASFLGNYCDLGLPNGIPSNTLILTQQALTESVSSGSDCTSTQNGSGTISSTGIYGLGGSIDLTAISLREDWATLTSGGPYGTLNWLDTQISGNASSLGSVNGNLPDPIMIQVSTDATGSHGQSISLASSAFGSLTSATGWVAKVRFVLPQASTNQAMALGFGTTAGGPMTTGLYVRFNTNLLDSHLTFVARNSGGTSTSATTVLDTSVHTLTISSAVAGEVTFQLDSGNTVCFTAAATGCSGSATALTSAHMPKRSELRDYGDFHATNCVQLHGHRADFRQCRRQPANSVAVGYRHTLMQPTEAASRQAHEARSNHGASNRAAQAQDLSKREIVPLIRSTLSLMTESPEPVTAMIRLMNNRPVEASWLHGQGSAL